MGIQQNIRHSAAERAKFREMKEGTAEDWAIIGSEYRAFAKGLADRVLDHPHFEACREFCEKYDQAAFDPEYDSEPLDVFEPMVRRVMQRPLTSMYAKATEEG